MALIKCSICNKYYDTNKHSTCPFCFSNSNQSYYDTSTKTVAVHENDYNDFEQNEMLKTQSYDDGIEENEKTIGIYFENEHYNPVTGWILCVKGTVKGKSYELHMNRNFIGRDKLMDISIPDDLLISRKNHLSITYDCKTHTFFANAENGSVYVNDSLIHHPVKLKENDILSFGESSYIFIPYCNDERNWENSNEKDNS